MDETTAVDALGRFGLSAYEARVFIALQKLGSGTASEVAEATDVPRSQVYGAADALADRGLVEIQQSSPLRYRPVPPEEAETRLSARLADERERAFEYLADVRGSLAHEGERRAEIWTVEGAQNVTERVRSLVADAEDRVLIGTSDPALLDETLRDMLSDHVASDISVVVTSAEEAVLEKAPPGVTVQPAPPTLDASDRSRRVLVIDGKTVLLGVHTADGGETAVWSAGTGFATVLARLVEGLLGDPSD